MNRQLGGVREWLSANKLSHNIEKSKIAQTKNRIEYLVVITDKNLNWKDKVSEILKKLNVILGLSPKFGTLILLILF